jgi:hypothetical protein
VCRRRRTPPRSRGSRGADVQHRRLHRGSLQLRLVRHALSPLVPARLTGHAGLAHPHPGPCTVERAANPSWRDLVHGTRGAENRPTGVERRRTTIHNSSASTPLAARRLICAGLRNRPSTSHAAGRITLPAASVSNRSSGGRHAGGGIPLTAEVEPLFDAVIDGRRVAQHDATGVARAGTTVSPARAEGHPVDARTATGRI